MNARNYNSFNRVTVTLVLCVAALVCATSQSLMAALPSASGDYTIQVIDPPSDANPCGVYINNQGVVVMGYYYCGDDSMAWHCRVLKDDVWTEVNVPGAVVTGATVANSSGRLALTYAHEYPPKNGTDYHMAIYHMDRGIYQYIPDPPDCHLVIFGFNDIGQMAACNWEVDPNIRQHTVLLDATLSLFQIFDPPGSEWSAPQGLNNAGLIVGQYWMNGGLYGYLYDSHNQTFTSVDVPEKNGAGFSSFSSPIGINNSGDIVGLYIDSQSQWSGYFRGYILHEGEFKDFMIPESLGTSIGTINDRGQLSGGFTAADGRGYGFIATPMSGGK
jgi:hypothetical protein